LPTQSDGRQTAAESLHTNQSGRDVLEHHLRCNPTQLIEDKVICYVQRFVLQIPQAGLHFAAWLRCKADFPIVMRFGYETGVRPVPLSFYCMQAKLKPAFVFGFAAWSAATNSRGLDEVCVGTQRKPSKILGNETVLSMRFTVRICCKWGI
jgi:hypothetical protein